MRARVFEYVLADTFRALLRTCSEKRISIRFIKYKYTGTTRVYCAHGPGRREENDSIKKPGVHSRGNISLLLPKESCVYIYIVGRNGGVTAYDITAVFQK